MNANRPFFPIPATSAQRSLLSRSVRSFGLASLLAALIGVLLAPVAWAQSDEDATPTVTITSSHSTITKGPEEVEITIAASSAPTGDISIGFQYQAVGSTFNESITRTIQLQAGKKVTWLHLAPGEGTATEDFTVTITLLAGAGYTVGSPSTVRVRVLMPRRREEPTPKPEDPQPEAEPAPPTATPAAAPTATPIVGATSAATATELPGDRVLIERHHQPGDKTVSSLELGVGWVSNDGSQVVLVGAIRDRDRHHTFIIVRHEGSSRIVRRWIPPTSPLVFAIPWGAVISQYSVPAEVLAAVPLDERLPEPNMLVRRYDGSDDRVFAYDAALQQWRHIPDYPTFQAMGFNWIDVIPADGGFFERITYGPPFPSSSASLPDGCLHCRT